MKKVFKCIFTLLLINSISGQEIIDIFAIKPSKMIGELKNEIKNQILDGKIKNDKEEALELLIRLGKSRGLKTINLKQ